MVDSKKVQIKDLLKMPRLKRQIYFRYGPIAFHPHFTLALSIADKGNALIAVSALASEPWVGGASDVEQLVAKIQEFRKSSFDPGRHLLQKAYGLLLNERRRPPTQTELFRREWELGIESALKKYRPTWTGDLRKSKLDRIYSGECDTKIPNPSHDMSGKKSLLENMGLVLLNGQALNRYRTIYEEMRRGCASPDLPSFVKQSLDKYPCDPVKIEDLPIDKFIEVLAAPFSLDPRFRWRQGEELYGEIIRTQLEGGDVLSDGNRGRVEAFYRLLLEFGNELEELLEEFQPTSQLSVDARWSAEVQRILYETVKREGKLPDFCAFWLENTEWTDYMIAGGEGLSGVEVFIEFASAYRRILKSSADMTVGAVAAHCPEIGILANMLGPEIVSQEALIYYIALDMDPTF